MPSSRKNRKYGLSRNPSAWLAITAILLACIEGATTILLARKKHQKEYWSYYTREEKVRFPWEPIVFSTIGAFLLILIVTLINQYKRGKNSIFQDLLQTGGSSAGERLQKLQVINEEEKLTRGPYLLVIGDFVLGLIAGAGYLTLCLHACFQFGATYFWKGAVKAWTVHFLTNLALLLLLIAQAWVIKDCFWDMGMVRKAGSSAIVINLLKDTWNDAERRTRLEAALMKWKKSNGGVVGSDAAKDVENGIQLQNMR